VKSVSIDYNKHPFMLSFTGREKRTPYTFPRGRQVALGLESAGDAAFPVRTIRSSTANDATDEISQNVQLVPLNK
jgi:hypothetical protein